MSSGTSRLIKLGVISSAHGVRGQVKIRSFTADPDNLAAYGDLQDKSGKKYNITVLSSNKDVLIAAIKDITDRNEAEKLRSVELYIPRSALPDPEENEYYHEDLIGLEVFTAENLPYGRVISVHNFGAGDIIEVRLVSGKEEFLPFNKATFPIIDTKSRKLVLSKPEAE